MGSLAILLLSPNGCAERLADAEADANGDAHNEQPDEDLDGDACPLAKPGKACA